MFSITIVFALLSCSQHIGNDWWRYVCNQTWSFSTKCNRTFHHSFCNANSIVGNDLCPTTNHTSSIIGKALEQVLLWGRQCFTKDWLFVCGSTTMNGWTNLRMPLREHDTSSQVAQEADLTTVPLEKAYLDEHDRALSAVAVDSSSLNASSVSIMRLREVSSRSWKHQR